MTDQEPVGPRRRGQGEQGRVPPTPPRRVGRSDETSLRGGALGIFAVVAATLAISVGGAVISLIVSLLY